MPDAAGAILEFHEIDVARVRLIHDLRRDMDVGEDAVPLVLSLLDQVYELRSRLRSVLRAVEAQPREAELPSGRRCGETSPELGQVAGAIPSHLVRRQLEPAQDGVGHAGLLR